MAASFFMLLFWLGFSRFNVDREKVFISKREWEEIYKRNDKPLIDKLRQQQKRKN